MDTNLVILLVASMVVIGAAASFIVYTKTKKQDAAEEQGNASVATQMQAYERLLLLTDRIALPNLISRVAVPGISAAEMRQVLVQNIKEEFNYNISQQLYVSDDAWTALKNLRDQDMLIINQVAGMLPDAASGHDLNKSILEYLMRSNKGNLHEMVASVLSFEAKKAAGLK